MEDQPILSKASKIMILAVTFFSAISIASINITNQTKLEKSRRAIIANTIMEQHPDIFIALKVNDIECIEDGDHFDCSIEFIGVTKAETILEDVYKIRIVKENNP